MEQVLETGTLNNHLFRKSYRQWFIAIVLILVLAASIGVVLLRNYSDTVAQVVDEVRAVMGPRPVAMIEETVFKIEDLGRRMYYKVTGNSASGWYLVAPSGQVSNDSHLNIQPISFLSNIHSAPVHGGTSYVSPLAPLSPLIVDGALPGEGQWRPLLTSGQPTNQPPILWRTVFRPDPSRPFVQVAVVAMDLSRSQLHLTIGTEEPKSKLTRDNPRPGMIPPEIQSSGALLAAWNGGFKAVHGHYGIMSDGLTWLPPKPGMATLAIEKDGRVLIGAWGNGAIPNADMIAWRQNNPPLIENGIVNPEIHNVANDRKWGATITKMAYTWRSGLGLSKDNRWLFYVAGNSLTTETLTKILNITGAYNAMQTDINHPFDRFDTFNKTSHRVNFLGQNVVLPLKSNKLIDKMNGDSTQFLVPYKRDFFYLTSSHPATPSPIDSTLNNLWTTSQVPRTPVVTNISSVKKINEIMNTYKNIKLFVAH